MISVGWTGHALHSLRVLIHFSVVLYIVYSERRWLFTILAFNGRAEPIAVIDAMMQFDRLNRKEEQEC